MNRLMNRSLSLSSACLILASLAPPLAAPAEGQANFFGSATCQVSCPSGYRGACGVSGCTCSCGCASPDALEGIIEDLRGKGFEVFDAKIDPAVIFMGDNSGGEGSSRQELRIEPSSLPTEEASDTVRPERTITRPKAGEEAPQE